MIALRTGTDFTACDIRSVFTPDDAVVFPGKPSRAM